MSSAMRIGSGAKIGGPRGGRSGNIAFTPKILSKVAENLSRAFPTLQGGGVIEIEPDKLSATVYGGLVYQWLHVRCILNVDKEKEKATIYFTFQPRSEMGPEEGKWEDLEEGFFKTIVTAVLNDNYENPQKHEVIKFVSPKEVWGRFYTKQASMEISLSLETLVRELGR